VKLLKGNKIIIQRVVLFLSENCIKNWGINITKYKHYYFSS
jgi:hypothetical protein